MRKFPTSSFARENDRFQTLKLATVLKGLHQHSASISSLEGRYEYKYIVDGRWTTNKKEPLTEVNKDWHINNYVEVSSKDLGSYSQELHERLASEDGDLTKEERSKIRRFLEAYPDHA